jgi:hypothetical protein
MRVKTVPSKPQDGAVDAAQQVEVQSGWFNSALLQVG